MRGAALIPLLMGLLASGQEVRWQNSYDQPLYFNCPAGQSISYIKSQRYNYEDRLWDFGCKDTFNSPSDCFMSPYANDFYQEYTFECPQHYFITGMNSYHYKYEDIRWQFYCCRSAVDCTANCEWTTYVNYFDEPFHWNVPNGNFLVGAKNYHDNHHVDRRWMYKYCSKVQC